MSEENSSSMKLYEDENYCPEYNIDVVYIDCALLPDSETPFIDLEHIKRMTLRSVLVAGEFCDLNTISIAHSNLNQLAQGYHILGFQKTSDKIDELIAPWRARMDFLREKKEKMLEVPENESEFTQTNSE